MIIRPLSDISALLSEDSNTRLRGILQRSSFGNAVDLRSPLFDAQPRNTLKDALLGVIGLFGHPEMDAIDEHEYEKIGPYSIRLPFEKIKSGLFDYFTNDTNPGDPRAFEVARERIMNLVPYRSLRTVPLEHAFSAMPEGTNMGLPLLTREKKDAHEYLERARSIQSYLDIYPFILFWRGQPNGTDTPKQRHVCGADHVDTILWESFLIPLLAVFRGVKGFAAWNDASYIDGAMTEVLVQAKRNNRIVISGDHSSFDTHLNAKIINVCFDAIEGWFQECDSRIINILREEFLHTGIVCPDGWLDGRNGSVMSGSGGTNFIDSLGNYFASEYVSARTGSQLEQGEFMGDDFVSVWSTDLTEDLEDLMLEIGLVTNKEKQFVSFNSCHYLQRWHSLENLNRGVARGVRSPFRALNGMLSYERLRTGWNKYMDTVRWIMQVEQVRWDKRFPLLVAYLKQGDEVLRSGIDPVDVFKLAGGSSKIRKVLGIESFPFNVKRPEGVESFATTSVLRKLMK